MAYLADVITRACSSNPGWAAKLLWEDTWTPVAGAGVQVTCLVSPGMLPTAFGDVGLLSAAAFSEVPWWALPS